MPFRLRRLLATSVAVVLLSAACGDDGGDADTTPDLPADPPADEPEPAGAEPSEAEPDPEPDQGTEPEPEPGEPLTATDTGVTAEIIRLGVAYPDLSVVGRDNGDVEAKFQVAIDAVNDAGGINGRAIEMHFGTYNPLDEPDFDAMCARHTEDLEVFAVIGIFLREQALCYTELHDTIAINHLDIDEDQIARSSAPLLAVPALSARTVETNVAALIDNGLVGPGDPVALHGNALDEELHQLYVDALEAAGIDIVSNTVRTQQTDIQAGLDEVQVFAEKWVAEGATAVIATVDIVAGDVFAASENVGLDLPILLPEGLDRPPSLIVAALGEINTFDLGVPLIQDETFVPQWAADVNGVRECVDRFETTSGEIVYKTETGEEPLENLGPTALSCELVELFAAVATHAGPELTTESFAAAVETIGAFTVTGVSGGSFGPGKPDYTDVDPRLGRYNPETQQFEAIG